MDTVNDFSVFGGLKKVELSVLALEALINEDSFESVRSIGFWFVCFWRTVFAVVDCGRGGKSSGLKEGLISLIVLSGGNLNADDMLVGLDSFCSFRAFLMKNVSDKVFCVA